MTTFVDEILRIGNDRAGAAAELWAHGIHGFVYKKLPSDVSQPFLRFEVESENEVVLRPKTLQFTIHYKAAEHDPRLVDLIADDLESLLEKNVENINCDEIDVVDIFPTRRVPTSLEGEWREEVEFSVVGTAA